MIGNFPAVLSFNQVFFFGFFETEGQLANVKFLSSREEISQRGIKPPISSLGFGYLSTII